MPAVVSRTKQRDCKVSKVISAFIKLDVTDGLRVASVARGMLDEKIDILINNAGYYGPRLGFGEIDYEDWGAYLSGQHHGTFAHG